MHGGAPAALLARAIENVAAPVPMLCTRVTIEFLRAVPVAPVRVTASPTREGRRLQMVEATLADAGGNELLRARAVRMRAGDVTVPADAAPGVEVPGPDESPADVFPGQEGEGFHLSANEIRFARGTFFDLGPSLAWFRLRMPVVAGESPTPLQRVMAAADFGNGVSRVLDFQTHLFVNTDLTVHLHRAPVGEWVAIDARTDVDSAGVGQSTTVLHDERGRVGVGAQSLYVDAR